LTTRTGILARDPVYWSLIGFLLNEYRKDVVPLTWDISPRTGGSTIFVIEPEDRIRKTAMCRPVKRFRVAHVLIVETEILSWREFDGCGNFNLLKTYVADSIADLSKLAGASSHLASMRLCLYGPCRDSQFPMVTLKFGIPALWGIPAGTGAAFPQGCLTSVRALSALCLLDYHCLSWS
jgi:hypothetical protein